MATIVNLRQARKQRARADKDSEAAANRARFGRTKAERSRDTQATERAQAHLDAHRLDPSDDTPDGHGTP